MLKECVAPEELEQSHHRREQLRIKALHDTKKQSAEQVVCIKINGVNCECCPECGRLASPLDTECHWCFQKLKRGI